MATIKLAEALLRRKELTQKVDYLQRHKQEVLIEAVVQRVRVSDGFDDLHGKLPRITMQDFSACLDWHSKQLRLIDAYIQQANWTTELNVPDDVMKEFTAPIK